MPGELAWGYYPTNKIWLPIQVDSQGRLKVDMSNINLDDLGDVQVPSPGDQYFLYYDNATSLWKARALVDADIPATICRDSELSAHAGLPDVHHATHVKTLADHPLSIIPTMDDDHIPATIARDTEVTAAVDAHAALKTAIHGVGSRYIAETSVEDLDLASHKLRHEYLGADEPQNPWRPLGRRKHVDCFWESMDQWTLGTTGSGYTNIYLMRVELLTGATQNSKAYLYSSLAFPTRGYWGTGISIRIAITNWEARLWLTQGDGITPVDTEKHVGFTIIDGDIFASCADGTTETRVDTGVNIVAWYTYALTIIGNVAGTEFKFYIGHVLKATISTNTPTVWTHRWMVNVINDGVAADRGVYVFGFTFEDVV